MKKRYSDNLPFLILVLLWIVFHFRVLFLGHTFVLSDCSGFFFPLWKWGAGVWRQGLLPLWNPDAGFGTPYLADPQMAAWYPPVAILYRWLDPVAAFNGLILGHHLWALLGFWLFARGRGFSLWLSLCGSVVFGFSFNAVSLSAAPIMLLTYAWIPWVFLTADRLWRGTRNSFLALSAALAMQMAAGYPVYAYLTILSLGLDGCLKVKGDQEFPKRKWANDFTLGFAAVLLAVCYNLAWLLPFKEFVPLSNLSDRLELAGSLGWDDLLSWFNPFLKGHPLHSHPEAPFSVTVFFSGLPLLVVLIWGIGTRGFKRHSWVLFAVMVILSLGETAGMGGWLKIFFPVYEMVVRSGYWIPFVVWASSVLLMEAGEGLAGDKIKTQSGKNLWVLGAGLVYGTALLTGVPWELATFWVSLFFTLLAGTAPSLPSRPVYLFLSLFFSLGPAAQSMNFTMAKSYYETQPKIMEKMVKPGRIHHPLALVEGFRVVAGSSVGDVYEKLKASMVPDRPLGLGLEETCFYNSLFLRSYLKWYGLASGPRPQGLDRVLDYLNVRYFWGAKPGLQWVEGGSRNSPWGLWENPKPLPKWFSVPRAGGLFPVDFGKECFVADPALYGGYHLRQVSESGRTPSRLSLEMKGTGKALLVSSETLYPGWSAVIDGKTRPVIEVNRGFKGLVIENGEEKAALVYHPTSFRLGCFCSLLVCGFWAGMILNIRKPKNA